MPSMHKLHRPQLHIHCVIQVGWGCHPPLATPVLQRACIDMIVHRQVALGFVQHVVSFVDEL